MSTVRPLVLLPIAIAAACATAPSGNDMRSSEMSPSDVAPADLASHDLPSSDLAPLDLAHSDSSSPPSGTDPMRSLAVVDVPTLESQDDSGHSRFTLERVLEQILVTGHDSNAGGAAELYQRIFDTNNTAAGAFIADGQHCDDEKGPDGSPQLNGFPLQCPRQEGALADLTHHNPFCIGDDHCDPYSPIGLFNRFDTAPADGSNCGEYRMIFAKGVDRVGLPPLQIVNTTNANTKNRALLRRVLVNFEAILPNPHPEQGLAGCAPVIEFWASLSAIDNPVQRGAELDRFFFTGLPGFDPAVSFGHYTGTMDAATKTPVSGRIRGNQFLTAQAGQVWQLREYHLENSCTGTTCIVKVHLAPDRGAASSRLFDDSNMSPIALSFRDPQNPSGFLAQVASLAADDLNRINLDGLDPLFFTGQSSSQATEGPVGFFQDESDYVDIFNPSGGFAAAIQTELNRIGSLLTSTQIVARAQTQNCGGCHELSTSTSDENTSGSNILGPTGSPLIWPDSLGFTQVSEEVLVPTEGSTTKCDTKCTANPTTCPCAWQISDALKNVFLPFRIATMKAFLGQ